jgi:hypothetical protein
MPLKIFACGFCWAFTLKVMVKRMSRRVAFIKISLKIFFTKAILKVKTT